MHRFGTYSTVPSIKAGLDLEMPGPARVRGDLVKIAVASKQLSERVVDDRVRALLVLINRVMKTGVPENAPEQGSASDETSRLLREVSGASQVLLKNEGQVLPFSKEKTVRCLLHRLHRQANCDRSPSSATMPSSWPTVAVALRR